MDDDRLSPELGRLIDTVKAAARAAGPAGWGEAVALLTGSGDIHRSGTTQGPAGRGPGGGCSAARDAVNSWGEAGGEDILAAALAWVDGTAEDALPCSSCREALSAVDPDLPLVIKRKGRWVVVPLSGLPRDSSEGA